jgi:copper chaperone CopZ
MRVFFPILFTRGVRLLLGALVSVTMAVAADPKPVEPHPTTQTFFIANVANEKDVAAINDSLKKVKSFTKVEGLTPTSGYAKVSFDSHADSYHQIAQAIADAPSTSGKQFEVTMKIRIPDYAKGDNAAKVDAVFAKQKADVTVETVDKEKGEFVLHYLPLKVDETKHAPQGFNGGKFGHPIHDAPPKGLGLTFAIVQEGAKAPAKKP